MHKTVWVGVSFTAIVILGLSYLLFPNPPLPIFVRLAAIFIGASLDILVRIGQLSGNLRKTFGSMTPLQTYGLIVNPDQMVFIIGDNRINFPWNVIGRTWEASGIVLYQRAKDIGLIPDYAFRSREDAKAFVGTVNALKKGLPPPDHDWSAYVPKEYTSDGVWPPPVN